MIVKNQNKNKTFLRFEASAKQKEYLELLAKIRGVSRQELLTQVVERFIDNNIQLIQNYKNEIEELNNRTSEEIKMQGGIKQWQIKCSYHTRNSLTAQRLKTKLVK